MLKASKPTGQSTYLEEEVFISQSTITGSRVCQSFCQNPLDSGKDEFTEGALTKSSNIYICILATLHTLTPTSISALLFTNELFKKFMKVYLKNQNQAQLFAPIYTEF